MNITTDMDQQYSPLQLRSQQAAFFSALAFAFFIPISPALMNIFLFFTLIFVLLSGNLKEHWATAWNNPVAKAGILFFLLFAAGTTWSIVDFGEALYGLKKYNELWYIALLLPLFHSEQRRELGLNVFLASMLFILVTVYSIYFGLFEQMYFQVNKNHGLLISVDGGFRTHIITNILMSFAAFILAQRTLLNSGKKQWTYGSLFLATFYYSVFISTGTTGQILTIGLIILLIIQHFKAKSLLLIPVLLTLIFSYGYSQQGGPIQHAINKITGGIERDGGSASQRREFSENALYLLQEYPFLGSGTGSISRRYTQLPEERVLTNLTTNPHNEYAATAIQLGLAGIIGLLILFYTQLRTSYRVSKKEYHYLAQGLVAFIVVASLGNSMLMDSGEGHFWSYISAILFSAHQSSQEID